MNLNNYKLIPGLFLLFALVLSACGGQAQAAPDSQTVPTVTADLDVIVEGNLVPADYLAIPFALSGRVDEILVAEGELVQEGEVLLRLGARESFEAAVAAASLELENAEQALQDVQDSANLARSQAWLALMDAEQALIAAEVRWDAFEDSDFADDLDDAELDVIEAEEDLEEAREDVDQYDSLEEENSLRSNAEDALEEAEQEFTDRVRARDLLLIEQEREEALLAQAQSVHAEAQRAYNARLEGPDPDDLALAEARLDNARAQLAAAQAAFENLEVIAPMAGTVVELYPSVGEQVMAGQQAVLLADFTDWYVETRDLTELEVVEVSVGQQVLVVPDSLPDLELTGTVESIADVFEERLGDITYTVRIRMQETDPLLRWGMTVEVTFDAEE